MRTLVSKATPKLWQVAILGFAAGVFLHACVFVAVLDDGSSEADAPVAVPTESQPVVSATATPLPTQPPDRTDCEEIRGTDYHSAAERDFFLRNCVIR